MQEALNQLLAAGFLFYAIGDLFSHTATRFGLYLVDSQHTKGYLKVKVGSLIWFFCLHPI
jgi:helix-turn-helix protein